MKYVCFFVLKLQFHIQAGNCLILKFRGCTQRNLIESYKYAGAFLVTNYIINIIYMVTRNIPAYIVYNDLSK